MSDEIKSQPFDSSWVDLKNAVESLRARLTQYEDAYYSDFIQHTLPNSSCRALGVRVAAIRQTVKEILAVDGSAFLDAVLFPKGSKQKLSEKSRLAHTLNFCEERLAIAFLIGQVKISFDKRLDAILAFLPYVDSWYVCDTLCAAVKLGASERPDFWEFIGGLLANEEPYEQRVAVVFMLKRFIDKNYVGAVFERIEDLARRRITEHTVSMATAWLICEAAIKTPDVAFRYLERNSLDDATFNRALQKMCDSRRIAESTKDEIRGMRRVKSSRK